MDMSAINAWTRRRRRLIGWLGIPRRQAWFHKSHVDELASDSVRWWKHSLIWLGAGLVVLVLLVLAHLKLVQNTTRTIKLAYLLAYSFGLIGTVFAAYGFRAHLRGITERRETLLRRFPDPLRTTEVNEVFRYTRQLAEFFQAYFQHIEGEEWQQAKVELRKQLALLTGMTFIALSFAIQIGLQFF